MAHFDGRALHGVEHLEAGHDFAGGESLDLEFVVGGFADHLRHHLGAAMQRIERFRPARRHPPFDFRHRLRNRRRCDRRRTRHAQSGDLDEISTFHDISLDDDLLFASSLPRIALSMEHPVLDFHPAPGREPQKKPGLARRPGFRSTT